MSSSNFDLTQTLFLYNWASNAAAKKTGTSSDFLADLTDVIDKVIALTDNAWSLDWGPGVKTDNDKATNAAFVMKNKVTNSYILALAGTNPSSEQEFVFQDLLGLDQRPVDWLTFDPRLEVVPSQINSDIEQIAYGFALGAHNLCTNLQYGSNTTVGLGDYLHDLAASDSTVYVTGHSLGGALTMIMGQWLQDVKIRNHANGTVLNMPTAAPDPGNATFQNKWDSSFKPYSVAVSSSSASNTSPDQVNMVTQLNCNVMSNQDLVPHSYAMIYVDIDNSSDAQNTAYFQDSPSTATTVTPIATIGDAEYSSMDYQVLFDAASAAQTAANKMGFKQTDNTITFDVPTAVTIKYKTQNNVTETAQIDPYLGQNPPLEKNSDTGPNYGFIPTIMNVHLWGYGSAVFGIDFSVFDSLDVG